ncbi:putative transposase [Candidatus Accumulibacter contiguus]|uniref:putative transposase n=1 Tax=Candidatus Accumulibacter contiguus TaxID=2954381 RepID=UPI002FC2ADB0
MPAHGRGAARHPWRSPRISRRAAEARATGVSQRCRKDTKKQRKETASHMLFEELPEEQRFRQLSTHSQQLLDTIKMIAYRSETAMANTLCEKNLVRHDKARSLLQALFMTEADLLPDEQAGTLTVRLHHMANSTSDQAIRKLCDE